MVVDMNIAAAQFPGSPCLNGVDLGIRFVLIRMISVRIRAPHHHRSIQHPMIALVIEIALYIYPLRVPCNP